MQGIIEKLIELLRKAPKWLKAIIIALLAILIGSFSWLYVSCGSLNLKDLRWQYGKDSVLPVSDTSLDITE